MRPLTLLTLLAPFVPYAFAYPKFTAPAPGASESPGSISVAWEDDGSSPSINQLTTYTLQLMVGGNSDSDAVGYFHNLGFTI